MFSLLSFSFSLIVLIAASYTDLKKRIVSNKLTFGSIALGLLLHAAWAFAEGNPWIFGIAVFTAGYAFVFAYILYKIGLWAGGDVKLLTGIAALAPLNPFIAGKLGLYSPQLMQLFEPISLPVFPISLFVFTLFSMLPVTIFITMKRARSDKKAFNSMARDLVVVIALLVVSVLFSSSGFASMAFVLFSAALLYFVMKLMAASKVFLRKKVKITELEEGMISAETISVQKGVVKRELAQGMKSFINYIKHYNLAESDKRIIADNLKARGLTDEEISELQKLVKQGKLKNFVYVKESAPMVPAFLVAFIILNLIGDLLWNLVLA